MKVIKHEIYNEELNKLEEVDIYGFCGYCKDYILATDRVKKRKSKVYHEDCWRQKHL
ncbi:hypothetical protein LCGC14_2882570 [marine sediment metagenome]|uniref:LIM zinc-binding domain-containing protein n=1 Tax=marine sediment metagenome TaxID=412755 RepID=A0A0F8XZX8_9ZZZZ